MLARAALVASAVLLCLVLGLVAAPATDPAVVPAHPLRLAELRLDPAGVRAAGVLAGFAGSDPAAPVPAGAAATGPKPPPAPPRLLPPPPPPPPEADAVLRRAVSAVSDEHGRLSLVLAGGGGRLAEGDVFMGWRLASVTRTAAVLSKGGSRREVSFFAPAPPTRLPGAAAPTPLSGSTVPAGPPTARPPTAAEYFRGFQG